MTACEDALFGVGVGVAFGIEMILIKIDPDADPDIDDFSRECDSTDAEANDTLKRKPET